MVPPLIGSLPMADIRIAQLPATRAVDPLKYFPVDGPTLGDPTQKLSLSDLNASIVANALAASASGLTLLGDVTGTPGATVVEALRNVPVSPAAPTLNQILAFDGVNWTPATLSAPPVTLAGDVTGSSSATTVEKIQNIDVDPTIPTSGQVLTFDGTKWAPSTPSSGAADDTTMFFHWARRAGVKWVLAQLAGSYTTGMSFRLWKPMKIGGAGFWTAAAAPTSVLITIWKGGIAVHSESFPIGTGTTFNEVAFTTPFDVLAADMGVEFKISMFLADSTFVRVAAGTVDVANYTNQLLGAYFEYGANLNIYSAGSAEPITPSPYESYPIEPILRAA